MKEIRTGVFDNTNLKTVTVNFSEPIDLGRYGDPFSNCSSLDTLYVPVGAKEAFDKATYWNKFPHIVEKEGLGISAVVVDAFGSPLENNIIYDAQGRRVSALQNGLNIVVGENGAARKVMMK